MNRVLTTVAAAAVKSSKLCVNIPFKYTIRINIYIYMCVTKCTTDKHTAYVRIKALLLSLYHPPIFGQLQYSVQYSLFLCIIVYFFYFCFYFMPPLRTSITYNLSVYMCVVCVCVCVSVVKKIRVLQKKNRNTFDTNYAILV